MKNTFKFMLAAAALVSVAFAIPSKSKNEKFIVVIDAGHGGKDHGVTHDLTSEKMITEQISKKIKALNQNPNVEILLTRDSDQFTELKQRTDFANSQNADLVLSLHVNGTNTQTASGIAMFVGKENIEKEKSLEIASKLTEKLAQNHGFKIRPVSEAPFFILKNSKSPAIILELGFLTNDFDRGYLTSEEEQNKIAATIVEFVGDLK